MRSTKKIAAVVLVAGVALVPGTAEATWGPAKHYGPVFDSAVVGSLPTDPVIHGVAAGNAPWKVRSGSARLKGDGRLTVKLKGLVLTDGPFAGTAGPVTSVSASLYCGADSSGPVDTTATVPLSARGDARIDEVLDVPDRCLAPTVLVHPFNATAFYIAATAAA